MGPQSRANGDGFGVRVALFYAGLFVVFGIQMPFFPVWLTAKGLDPADIGFVLATATMVRVFAMPVIARLADRRGALHRALVVVSCGAVAAYVLLGLSDGFVFILAAVALSASLFAPLNPLVDAYAIRGLGLRGRAYGPVRLWGSVAFIAANLGAGYAGAHMPPTGYIWLIVAAVVVTAAAALTLRPLQPAGTAKPPLPPRRAWSLPSRGFLVTAAAASLIQASHAVYYGFSTLDWTAKGLSGTAIGALWGLGVVAEIVLFAFSGRLPAAISPRVLLIVGAVGGVVRWGAMALDPPSGLIPVLQCLHGLSFGATYLGAVQFLARTAPAGAAATAQADLSTMNGLAMAAASGLSGVLFEKLGDAAYAAMALCAGLGGAVILLAPRRPQGAD